MTKILITGHKGYVGSYLYKTLAGISGKRTDLDGVDLVDGLDIKDLNFYPSRVSIIINCAAELVDPLKMLHTNVQGLEEVIFQAKRWGAKLIHFSSVSIYGSSYYGLTKKMGEDLIRFWNPKDWCILRLTNIYSSQLKHKGGDSPANRFERGETKIFGTGIHTKDHVALFDVLQAVKLAIKDNWTGEVNLASGDSLSINSIFARKGQGEALYIDKKVDMVESKLDNTRALKLGWRPTWSLVGDWGIDK